MATAAGTSQSPERRDITAILNYFERPTAGSTKKLSGPKRTIAPARAKIQDVTGREQEFSLDVHGFQLVHWPSADAESVTNGFRIEHHLDKVYHDDCAALLRQVTGSESVFVFHHKVRYSKSKWRQRGKCNKKARRPLHSVHVDQSDNGAEFLLRWYLPKKAKALRKQRWQIVNIWRPIKTIYKEPLALADGRSVPQDDLAKTSVVQKGYKCDSWMGICRRAWAIDNDHDTIPTTPHLWYYKHAQTPDEVWVFKCFDSLDDGSVTRHSLHTSFEDVEYEDFPARESIEARAFIFYGEKLPCFAIQYPAWLAGLAGLVGHWQEQWATACYSTSRFAAPSTSTSASSSSKSSSTTSSSSSSRGLASVAPVPKLDEVTTLPNGIRVASEALPDAFSGVGVYIDAGSRYENEYLRGASHIMDRLAFKSTSQRSADDMLEAVESLGGNIQCASSRESMMYQAATFNSAIPTAVGLLAETIRSPKMTDDEIAQQLETAAYEIKEIWAKPELILPELVHMAAFKDNTLGNPLLCPEERLAKIDRNVIQAYRDTFYRPDRMVVAFAGVAHEEAVKLAEEHFGDMPASVPATSVAEGSEDVSSASSDAASTISDSSASSTSSSASSTSSASTSSIPGQPSKLLSKIPFFKNLSTSASHNASVLSSMPPAPPQSPSEVEQPAHYTGGFLSLPPQPPPLNPNMPAFTHIQLAFEGLPILSDDIYALATLQTLLGGGGSFSAGGPGKGMYSRLYTNVLNQHGWVESCVAFNHSYADSGLFGIAASCYPGRTAKMLEVLCRELRALTLSSGFAALGQAEVSRAKNQLRSSLLMNLESRMVELEDLGRQVQVHGRKIPAHEMVDRINALTVDDLRRVATMVVQGLVDNPGGGSGAPTVVLQEATMAGLTAKQLQWDEIQDIIYKWQLGRR